MGLSNVLYDSECQVPARKEQEGEMGDSYLVDSYQHFIQLACFIIVIDVIIMRPKKTMGQHLRV